MQEMPLIPARMLNEHVYCPRLAYLMWVQGEFRHNEYTVDGVIRHRRVDKGGGTLPVEPEENAHIHARSVSLSSERLGLIAKMDLVEGEGMVVAPVDYKRGKRPHKVASGVYEPEQVQICAQGLLLEENGYSCPEGLIYFVASKERVRVPLDGSLRERTPAALADLRRTAEIGRIPAPLEDSPKCPRYSLVGICLPDEIRFLARSSVPPRPMLARRDAAKPLYVQSQRAYVRKNGEVLVVEQEKERVATARLDEVSQLVLFGSATLTTPALHECLRREIPVTWLSYGGWFMGHTMSVGNRNVETRTHQYRCSFDEVRCLDLARRLVAGKTRAMPDGLHPWLGCWEWRALRQTAIFEIFRTCSAETRARWVSIFRPAIADLPKIRSMPCFPSLMPCSPGSGPRPCLQWDWMNTGGFIISLASAGLPSPWT